MSRRISKIEERAGFVGGKSFYFPPFFLHCRFCRSVKFALVRRKG